MRDRAVFEFRDTSWYEQDTFDLLNARGVALCVHDMGDKAPPRIVTGGMVYVRFHGTNGRYQGNYPDPMLQDWAAWMKSRIGSVRAIYAYFNNDISGHALNNARPSSGSWAWVNNRRISRTARKQRQSWAIRRVGSQPTRHSSCL